MPIKPEAEDSELLAYSIPAVARRASVGRDLIYRAIVRGELTARKLGGRTVVLHEDLNRWLAALPTWRPRSREHA